MIIESIQKLTLPIFAVTFLLLIVGLTSSPNSPESFCLLNDSGDTLFTVTESGDVKVNGDLILNGSSLELPLGSILPWNKTFAGNPSIKSVWVECNGQVLDDIQSPMNGMQLPDLNGITTGKQKFLRGSSSSGDEGGLDHVRWISSHYSLPYSNYKLADNASAGNSHGQRVWNVNGSPQPMQQDNYQQDYYTETNLPSYYEVVWVMKIK